MSENYHVINFNKSIIMEKDKEAEKLHIDPEKIIHILLKHLMYLKNENAYLKNYVGIISSENGITENNIGINNLSGGIVEKNNGINNLSDGITEKNNGINNLSDGITKNNIGINNLSDGITENNNGINFFADGITEKNNGINFFADGITEKNNGINFFADGITEKNNGINFSANGITEKSIGTKFIFNALSTLDGNANANVLLYTVFEQGLINALNQYIKNGNGQNTLYSYYAYFVEAVEEKNLAASKLKEAAKNLRLEDTHILPQQITVDGDSLRKLSDGLHGYLPRTARWDLYLNVANELLLLHNAGKATGTQLRNIAQLSVPGFAKHLPKLKRSGLIIKDPPNNYILTGISKHILLKTFGIPKNN